MSNLWNDKTNKRIISLKKIQVEQEDGARIVEPQQTKENIQTEIEMLKQTLQQLEQEKETSISTLENYIATEKEKLVSESEHILTKAKEQGFKEGYAEGERAAKERFSDSLEQANTIVQQSERDYHATLEKNKGAIVRIAIKVAKKIVDKELETDDTLIIHMIEKALQQLKDTSSISISVHPKYYGLVHEQKDELKQLLNIDEMLYVYSDTNLQENDCIIRHPFGKIDASVDTQLQQIKQALEEKVMENGDGY